jgi:ferredoxin--NADP+ reductase
VPNGPLTSRLQHIVPGDKVIVGRKPVGTLLADNLRPGRNLYLLGTGTGLAPFMCLVRDPDVYERFERIVLVHGCRQVAELAYEDLITNQLPNDEFLGEMVREKLLYYPTVTREPFRNTGRITSLMESGKMMTDLGIEPLDPAHDRVMLCGSPAMLSDLVTMLESRGFEEGNNANPGDYVIEKAFVEK